MRTYHQILDDNIQYCKDVSTPKSIRRSATRDFLLRYEGGNGDNANRSGSQTTIGTADRNIN